MTTLTVICGKCKKYMGEKDGDGVTGVSHSMCEECWERTFPGEPYPQEDDEQTA